MSFIYSFIFPDSQNGRYIGYAKTDVKHRWRAHYHNAYIQNLDNKLYRAMRQYGYNNIIKDVLDIHPDPEYTLKILEPFYITEYDSINNGYNTAPGGGYFPILYGKDNPSLLRKSKPMKDWFSEEQLETHKNAMSKRHSAENNIHARKTRLLDPNGNEYFTHGTLFKFCNEYNISGPVLYGILNSGGGTVPILSKKATRITEKRLNSTGWSIFPAD